MPSQLQLDRISRVFVTEGTKHTILKDVTLTFEQGQTYALTGPSGSGKSTLLQLLAGIDDPSSGNVLYNNYNISAMPQSWINQFRNQVIGFVFQWPYLIKELSVLENVILPGLIAGYSWKESKERGDVLLGQVGLSHKATSKPSALSGGQQQRVSLARALFNHPAFLLADEPTANLDEKTAEVIIELMMKLQQTNKMAIIASTHDDRLIKHMEHKYYLHEGNLSFI